MMDLLSRIARCIKLYEPIDTLYFQPRTTTSVQSNIPLVPLQNWNEFLLFLFTVNAHYWNINVIEHFGVEGYNIAGGEENHVPTCSGSVNFNDDNDGSVAVWPIWNRQPHNYLDRSKPWPNLAPSSSASTETTSFVVFFGKNLSITQLRSLN